MFKNGDTVGIGTSKLRYLTAIVFRKKSKKISSPKRPVWRAESGLVVYNAFNIQEFGLFIVKVNDTIYSVVSNRNTTYGSES